MVTVLVIGPDHTDLRWDHADARLIVYGHTHIRVVDQKEVPWVVNPGASGKVRNHGGPFLSDS